MQQILTPIDFWPTIWYRIKGQCFKKYFWYYRKLQENLKKLFKNYMRILENPRIIGKFIG